MAPARQRGSIKRRLQALLEREAFIRSWGFRIVALRPLGCTIELPYRRAFERPGGIVNGPALMAAADCAMWLAVKAAIGVERDALTSELNTAFLAAAKRQAVRCTARILKLGKRSIYGVAECHSRSGRIFSHHTVTYVRLPET